MDFYYISKSIWNRYITIILKIFFFWKDDMICMHVKKIRRLKTAWSKHGSYMSLIQLIYSHESIFDLLIHVVNYWWIINHLREKKCTIISSIEPNSFAIEFFIIYFCPFFEYLVFVWKSASIISFFYSTL